MRITHFCSKDSGISSTKMVKQAKKTRCNSAKRRIHFVANVRMSGDLTSEQFQQGSEREVIYVTECTHFRNFHKGGATSHTPTYVW